MKYMLIIIIPVALFLSFTACTKKATTTSCYTCTEYDSITSNIAGITGPTTILRTDTLCNNTSATISFYEKSHLLIDTFYHQNDTFKMNYEYYNCFIWVIPSRHSVSKLFLLHPLRTLCRH